MLLPLSVPQEPQKYAPVRTLLLYLTEECNLRCTYCFVKKQPKWGATPFSCTPLLTESCSPVCPMLFG